MDYVEAVNLAKAGDEQGYLFLYEETYRSKYYLALKYMKNEEAAKDVLQEAYLKAFSKLEMLKQPEAFSGWLGTIVGNTAKNMLVKKNPMLFSDIAIDEDIENLEYQIEDDNLEHQPELAYTRQETQELVQELIGELSDEQRLCILMFHIENASIREIAEALDCSENTVKSRLKYGRDNLKTKVEELQKKGYKLYNIAPLSLLLHLLRAEEAYFSVDGTLEAVGEHIAEQIFDFSARVNDKSISNVVKETVGNGTKVVKSGFIHTVVGKLTIAVVAVVLVSVPLIYGVFNMESKEQNQETEAAKEEENIVTEESHPQHEESETEQDVRGTEEDLGEADQDKDETKQNEIVRDDWKKAYTELIKNAPNQTYSYNDLLILEPIIHYSLLDMDGDSTPELILTVQSGVEEAGTFSFKSSYILIYSYNENEGVQAKGEYAYYRPGFLRDANNNLIIFSINSFGNALAEYYSIKMENGSLYEEVIYKGQFPDLEYVSTFNQENGFAALESNEIDSLSLIEEDYKKTVSEEDEDNKSSGKAFLEKMVYCGIYKNSNREGKAISIGEADQLIIVDQDNEYDIDTNNKQEDGAIEAYTRKNDMGDTSMRIYIYPVGTELSAFNHETGAMETTDKDKIRLFFTYQDVPDIRSNVYYKIE